LDLPSPVPSLVEHILHQNKPCHNNAIFSELDDTQFHKTVPNFSQFKATLKLGTRQVLEGQTKAQELGDFTNNFIAGCYPILAQFHHRLQHPS